MSNLKSRTALMFIILGLPLAGCVEAVLEPMDLDQSGAELRPEGMSSVTRLATGDEWIITTAHVAEAPTWDDADGLVADIRDGHVQLFSDETPTSRAQVVLTQRTSWQYLVIDGDYAPDTSWTFYDATQRGRAYHAGYALVEASLSDDHAGDTDAKDMNPVYELLIRQSDMKVLASTFTYDANGSLIHEQLDLTRRSDNPDGWKLEDPRLHLDYVLPPFALLHSDEMSVDDSVEGTLQLAFTSPVDGSLVVQRWDAGYPWFSYSVSDTRVSWRSE